MEQTPEKSPVIVCDIQFRNNTKIYFFDPGELKLNAGDEVKEGTTVALTISLGPETVTVQVPSVLGYTEADAIQALVNAGLTYSTNTAYSNTVPQGQVISQSINGGQQVDEGTTVTLTISLGPEPQPEPEPEPTPTPNPDEGDEDLPVLPTLP